MSDKGRKVSGASGEGAGGSDNRDGLLSPEQLEAISGWHSGMAQVSVQELAILTRCKSDRFVAIDELIASLMEWFSPMLSVSEVCSFVTRLEGMELLCVGEDGRMLRTSARGEEVLDQVRGPLLKSSLWMLRRKDEEGDRHVDR